MAKKQKDEEYRCNPDITMRLRRLRERAGLTLTEAANFFDVKEYETVAKWELGRAIPPESRRRLNWIAYLLNKLNLRSNSETIQQFITIWDKVMCLEWEWQPLSKDELWQYIPDQFKPISPTLFAGIPYLAPPRPDYDLIGRDDLLNQLKQRLFAGGNLAITALNGLPGIGKTALAIELAHDPDVLNHFRDGVLWARLGDKAGETQTLTELNKWAKAVGIASEELEKLTAIDAIQDAIKTKIGLSHLLLICDDAWQIEVALDFKLGGPNCVHMVTTRSRELALDFAHTGAFEVPELTDSYSQALLAAFAPQLNQEERQQLVEVVGGLPLGLILMGRYIRNHPSIPINETLDLLKKTEIRLQTLNLPVGGPERHPSLPEQRRLTLEAIINISYDALKDHEKITLEALSVFPPKPDTFSDSAALAVTKSTTDTLQALVNKYGLLERSGDRYTLHQTISEFSATKLIDETAYQRMAKFFVNYVEKRETDYDAIELEINNLHTALEAAFNQKMGSTLVRGVNTFYTFLDIRGLYTQAEQHLERAAQAARSLGDDANLATILNHLGVIAGRQGNYQKEEQFLIQSRDLARKLKNLKKICASLRNLGVNAFNQGKYDQTEEYFLENLDTAYKLKDDKEISATLNNLGILEDFRGHYDKAENYLLKSLGLAREIRDFQLTCSSLQNLGVIELNRGNYPKAEEYLLEGLAAAREISDRRNQCHILSPLGVVALNQGNYPKAEEYLLEGLDLARELKHDELISLMLTNLGNVEFYRGNYTQAERYYQDGLDLARRIGHKVNVSYLLDNLGELAINQGQYTQAEQYLLEGLPLARELKHDELISLMLAHLGNVEFYRGNYTQAERYYQDGLDLARRIGHKVNISYLLINLGELAINQGQYFQAEQYLLEGLALARESKHRVLSCNALNMRGELHLRQQDVKAASIDFLEAIEIIQEIGAQEPIATALYGLARVAKVEGNIAKAHRLGQESLTVFETIGHKKVDVITQWLTTLPAAGSLE